ncbi:stage V sporulation protein K [Caldanaerovirga acetigignens]|jgi:stage V sporulation protein K|uniref:Stage V sporulation protein K n=1 Tax=Caldanaerovirga acetigignens TaxID=447595 RepID=A0A1M7LD86_9FIRM|nr:stage V sporulation protein K [Caldanaerovirga acetigignens]SHM75351.1 stage V sporulation protein K [Caldanaerovirga acetigignens]
MANLNLKCKVENPDQIIDMIAKGAITPVEAFILFKEMDEKKETSPLKPNGEEKIEDVLKELDSLIGLTKVKQLVREIQAYVEIQKRRQKEQLFSEPLVLHMIFKGNPGTGKTTVARLLGKIFKQMEVLQKGHLVEVERADLVGEYIGHTAQKTREQVRRALGGILFIDEAYSLARGGEKDFGKEAIDTLVKAMEDYKDNLVVILAGYKDEMEWFLRTNPGLRSRFPIQIEFSDYTTEELMEIAKLMVEKRQYKLTPEALYKLERILKESQKNLHYDKMGNARLVRNLIEKAIRRQALRLISQKQISREDLIYIKSEDIAEIDEI